MIPTANIHIIQINTLTKKKNDKFGILEKLNTVIKAAIGKWESKEKKKGKMRKVICQRALQNRTNLGHVLQDSVTRQVSREIMYAIIWSPTTSLEF